MKSRIAAAAATVALALAMTGGSSLAQTKMVGGAPMYPTKTIVENAVNSADHTTLVAAVTAAGLVDALSGPGPFTVFAPVNAAFAALPAGTVDSLLLPENKGTLTKVLTAHVASGNWSFEALEAEATANGGSFAFKTLSGDTLTAVAQNGRVYIVDENGGIARITITDVNQSNGVIHVVNKVLLPK
jgi:uncharacterized surface protein with fasciclin (FAS1) repeats